MRILSVTQTYAPFLEFGGPPVKVRALAQGLVRNGNQATVLTADWGLRARAGSGVEGAAAAVQSPYGWTREERGVKAIYLPTWVHYRALSWNPAVKKFCNERLADFDVAHIFGLYDLLGPTVARNCLKQNIPYVLEPIGMFVPIVRNLRLKRAYHAIYGRRMFQEASAIIATSEQEAEELAGGGVKKEKIVLRRNGVETPASWPERGVFRKVLGIAPNANLILFLGRLSEKKSPELLLKAFGPLAGADSEKNLQLVFAGPDEGGMKARLEEKARQLGVTQRVRFAGAIFGEAKWAAYRDADVFVLPSQNENFGNAAAESVAAGTPVVVTEECGIAPLLADVAGLVVRHNEEDLGRAIQRLLTDEGLYGRLSAGCGAVTARLGWEEPVHAMESLYNRLAIESAGSAKFGS